MRDTLEALEGVRCFGEERLRDNDKAREETRERDREDVRVQERGRDRGRDRGQKGGGTEHHANLSFRVKGADPVKRNKNDFRQSFYIYSLMLQNVLILFLFSLFYNKFLFQLRNRHGAYN